MLRCGHSLLQRVKTPLEDMSSSGTLGDWYARAIFAKPQQLVLCTNEVSLLSVVMPLAPASSLPERFVVAASRRVRQIRAPSELLAREVAHLRDVRIGKAVSRSVISTMNQITYSLKGWVYGGGSGNLEELGLFLSDIPFTSISKTWPWHQAEFALTGSVAQEGIGWKVQANVL